MATLASVTLENYRLIQDPLQIKFPRSRPVVLRRWCTEVYHDPDGTVASSIHGTPGQVQEQLEALVVMRSIKRRSKLAFTTPTAQPPGGGDE